MNASKELSLKLSPPGAKRGLQLELYAAPGYIRAHLYFAHPAPFQALAWVNAKTVDCRIDQGDDQSPVIWLDQAALYIRCQDLDKAHTFLASAIELARGAA